MVQLLLGDMVQIQLIPYEQCDEDVGTHVLEDWQEFEHHVMALNQIICNSSLLEQYYQTFIAKMKEEYLYIFNQPQNRLLRRLMKKNLLPNRLSTELLPSPIYTDRDKLLSLISYFQCESHRDIMTNILQQSIQ